MSIGLPLESHLDLSSNAHNLRKEREKEGRRKKEEGRRRWMKCEIHVALMGLGQKRKWSKYPPCALGFVWPKQPTQN